MGCGASKTTAHESTSTSPKDAQQTKDRRQEQTQRREQEEQQQHPQQLQQKQPSPPHQHLQDSGPAKHSELKYLPKPTPPATKKKEYIPDSNVFADIDDHALQAPKSAASSVENLVNYLTKVCSTNLERIRVLFRWITNNIEYDVQSLRSGNIQGGNCTPDAVLQRGCGMCEGYAELFQDMCRRAGITCEKISGYAKGARYSAGDLFEGKDTDHAWNAVYVDNAWRLLDCTWATGFVNPAQPFQFKFKEHYFLTDPEEFIYTHFPYNKSQNMDKWQLLDTPWTLKQYEEAPFLKGRFFDLGISPSSLSHCRSLIEFDDSVKFGFSSDRQISVTHDLTDKASGQTFSQYSYLYVHQDDFKAVTLVVNPPSVGDYKLTLFAKERTAGDKEKEWIGDFLLRCTSVSCPKNPYPTGSQWGLNAKATALGLAFKGTNPSVAPDDTGLAKVEFKIDKNRPVETNCVLSKADGVGSGNSVLRTNTNDGFTYLVVVPSEGLFNCTLFAKPAGSEGSRQYMGDFLVESKSTPSTPRTFPHVYDLFGDGCELLEPMQGRLPANTELRFKLRVPDAGDVAVFANGSQWHHLENPSGDDLWQGNVATEVEGDLTVYKKNKKGTFSGLLKYTIA
ncbi:kyphoscoliosis peptidase-like [Patiria miniata]|uniref:Transglutaminase-like domain-containing protein n=1 Tax=Patiria miniata TaxID=46514 RepID=A0A913ZX37_PATMI|nr:kyphoscoliosis peptidase-like [Patiria miniata]